MAPDKDKDAEDQAAQDVVAQVVQDAEDLAAKDAVAQVVQVVQEDLEEEAQEVHQEAEWDNHKVHRELQHNHFQFNQLVNPDLEETTLEFGENEK